MDEEATFNRAFGQRVRRRRRELKLSQEGLGALLNLSRTSITNIEAGRQSVVAYTVQLLARHLRISADDLLQTTRPAARSAEQLFPDIKRADERAFLGRALDAEEVGDAE